MKRNIQTVSGVYGIYSPANLILYVGCSKNLNNRYSSHLNDLLFNKHNNKDLQEFSNLYGLSNLEFKILNFCNEDDLLYYEKLFINLLNPICNKRGVEVNYKDSVYNLIGHEYEIVINYIKNNKIDNIVKTIDIQRAILEKENIKISCKKISKVLLNIGYYCKKKSDGRYFILSI